MIDEEKTFCEKGYRSTDLSKWSKDKVFRVCDGCGEGKWIRFDGSNKLCCSCVMKIPCREKCETPDEKSNYVDDEITYAEKGYKSIWLKPKSGKLVWRVCAECGNGMWVRFQCCTKLCRSCAIKVRDSLKDGEHLEKLEYIDDEITYAEKGYRSTDLKSSSHKRVWCVCVLCGKGRWLRLFQRVEMCRECTARERRKYDYTDVEDICKSIDEEKTFTEMGYYSTELSVKSVKMVYAVCVECGAGRWVQFGQHTALCKKCANKMERNPSWKGGTSFGEYCKFFNEPLKDAIRNYFDNKCFECGGDVSDNKNRKMSVHHVNYQKGCGCDNTSFCIYVPLCISCHVTTNHNRWYWYTHFMTELALRNPNYYAHHVPVVFYDEPSYNFEYVFEKNRKN